MPSFPLQVVAALFNSNVDMLNHRLPKQTQWSYSNEREGFLIEALENINRGEQVFDSYGRKCNSRFLLNYGFIVENNDANEVQITVAFDADDPCLKLKQGMISDNSLEHCKFRLLQNYEENNVHDAFGFIRFAVIREESLLLYLQNIYDQNNYSDT